MSTGDHIVSEESDARLILRLDRPEQKNALSEELCDELALALEEAANIDGLRAIVLTGAGDAFSSGYDLTEAGGRTDIDRGYPTVSDGLDRRRRILRLAETIYNHPLPIIAAVNGYALAGGSDLALICDLTIASEEAQFGYPGVRMGGLSLSLIYPFVTGIKQARELMYSGKLIDAQRAHEMGMVNRVVSPDDLMEAVNAEVDEIRKTPGVVVRITKQMLNGVMDMQGYRPMATQSGFFATLSHQTQPGKRFFELCDTEGVNAAIEWMNETNKS